MPRRGLARKADGSPLNKTQRNHRSAEDCVYTNPEIHWMQSDGHYLQGYNCQLAVDSDHQVIVAVGVSNQSPDVEHLEPMLKRIGATAGALPDVMTADAGYWSEDNADLCADRGIDVPTSPRVGCPTANHCRQNADRCPRMLMPRAAWPES